MSKPIRMSKRDYEKLVAKQTGEWSLKYMTRRFKALEKRIDLLEGWVAKLARKIIHNKEVIYES